MSKISKAYQSFANIFFKRKILTFVCTLYCCDDFETLSIASIFPLLNIVFEGTNNLKNYEILNVITNLDNEKFLVLLIFIFISIFLLKAIVLTFFT